MVKYDGGSELLRHSIFSTAGGFDFGPEAKKSPKMGSRGLSFPGGRKSQNRVKKSPELTVFWLSDSFSTFSTPGPRGPRNPFSDFFSALGPKGPHDPCHRRIRSQPWWMFRILFFLSFFLPKGPRRTKNTTRSKFTTRSEVTIALRFTIAAHLVRTPLSWELQETFSFQRRVRSIVNMGGVVKTLRRSDSLFFYRRSIFSTERSFGCVDVSDSFYFSLLGRGVRGVWGAGRGVGDEFLLKIPGGGLPAEGPGGCLRGIRGVGAKYFFLGPKFPPSFGQKLPKESFKVKHGKYPCKPWAPKTH